ncbi:MAG: polyprenyl synthetase family protein [Dehalococcoidia bacterium]
MPSLSSSLPRVIAQHRDAVEGALQAALAPDGTAVTVAARYVMGWEDVDGRPMESGGKRIRPALALVAATAFGGTTGDAMPGAVAIELIHNFSLVHDEIQDRDDVRHNRPTAYTVWGEGQAINLGDFIFTRAFQALTEGQAGADRRVRAVSVLVAAVEGMIRGQWTDLAFEKRDTLSVEDYLTMAEGKTGVLLGASLEIGATLGGASHEDAAILGAWGRKLGLAFQAVDDWLGIWGTETGKPVGYDILRKKKSLPVTFALNDPSAARVIRDAFAADRQAEDLAAIMAAMEACGADGVCRETARRCAMEADALIAGLELTPTAREDLRAVGEYFCNRDF